MVLIKLKSFMKHFYTRSCLSKKQYTFFEALKRKIELMFIKEYVGIYKCRFGNHYHVGHKPNPKFMRKVNSVPRFTILDLKGEK